MRSSLVAVELPRTLLGDLRRPRSPRSGATELGQRRDRRSLPGCGWGSRRTICARHGGGRLGLEGVAGDRGLSGAPGSACTENISDDHGEQRRQKARFAIDARVDHGRSPAVHAACLRFSRLRFTDARWTARILLVDDEEAVQKLLTYPLRKEGYEVVPARRRPRGAGPFAEQRFDLVMLDIMLPKLDGIEVCRRLRSRSQVPIIMLTAKGDEIDKVLGLEMGADDYITKPFSVREFRSRVKAALRRGEMPRRSRAAEEPIAAGELRIDFERRAVTVRMRPVELTYVEFEILAALAGRPGQGVHARGAARAASGATRTIATRGRSTSTSATCARSSSATRSARVPVHGARGRLPLPRLRRMTARRPRRSRLAAAAAP